MSAHGFDSVHVLGRLRRGLPMILSVAALAWAPLGRAQVIDLDVTVNGQVTAPGTYDSAYLFRATCEGAENTTDTGDAALYQLSWTPQTGDQIFWDTAADCNSGSTVTDDGGTVISGNDVSGSIPLLPSTASAYGVGYGNVEFDLRNVLASALPRLYGDIFDGGDACDPPEKGTLYVCVTQNEVNVGSLTGTPTTLVWYMAVNYDTFTPEAPGAVSGQSGDSDVTVGWSFGDSSFPSQDLSFDVHYQRDSSGLVPDDEGVCSVAFDGGSPADAGATAIDTGSWQMQQVSGTLSSAQIDGLENGACYDFVVQAVLDDGTLGDNSSQVVVAPVLTEDFWRLYQQSGGADGGGLHCQSGGGGGLLGGLALVLGFRRKRSRP